MRAPRRTAKPSRPGPRGNERSPADFWRAVPEPDLPTSITPAVDPTALLRSLGPPPLPGQGGAERYVATVLERASSLATALAAAADLLADPDEA